MDVEENPALLGKSFPCRSLGHLEEFSEVAVAAPGLPAGSYACALAVRFRLPLGIRLEVPKSMRDLASFYYVTVHREGLGP